MLGTAAEDSVRAVATDGTDFLVAGYTTGALQATNAGLKDAFVAKYSAAGTLAWVRQWGSAGNDVAQDVEVDGTGAIVVGGSTTGALAYANQGGSDAFVSRWTSAGVLECAGGKDLFLGRFAP